MVLRVSRIWGALALALALVLALVVVPAGRSAALELGKPTTGWRPANGTVYSITRVGNVVILGGSFTSMEHPSGATAVRTNLAAINAVTGALLPWAPNPNGEVRAVASTGGRVYVGGTFTRLGGQARVNVGAVNLTNGAATGFRVATPNGSVRALQVYRGSVYLGGTFWKLGAAKRGGGAAVNPVTGALKAWNPLTNWGVYALAPAPDGSGMFVGGPFTRINGVATLFLAKVNPTSGAKVSSWRSGSTCLSTKALCEVFDLAVDRTGVYAAVGGPGGRVMALTLSTGKQRWAALADGDFQTVALYGNTVYGGGHFKDAVRTSARAGLVALAKSSGAVLPDPSFPVEGGTEVWSLMVDGRTLRMGGQFTRINGNRSYARYTSFAINDTQAPSTPGQPRVTGKRPTAVGLSWRASTDDMGVVRYRIYRNGTHVGTSTTPGWTDRTVRANTSYSYRVAALDAAGNLSQRSDSRSVTTPRLYAVKVAVSRTGYGNLLRVDVNPNRVGAYFFRVQRLTAKGAWQTRPGIYRTAGRAQVRTVALPPGIYRVHVLAGGDYNAGLSRAVVVTPPTLRVAAARDRARNKLVVNVDPNRGSGFYTFRVQQRTATGWVPLRAVYRTKGAGETATINLNRGTYRVVVAGKYGYRGAVSAPVVLAR